MFKISEIITMLLWNINNLKSVKKKKYFLIIFFFENPVYYRNLFFFFFSSRPLFRREAKIVLIVDSPESVSIPLKKGGYCVL